jgi:ABC-type nitrate/sulfonate/bicarbonate transport system ATPase subunit
VKHLFIDEGFLACDAENKKKIQDIINTMMHVGGYRSILLISHDEAIRSAAETIINVCRPDDASTSYIRMGDKREKLAYIAEEKGTSSVSDTPPVPAKKRGRPSKKELEERAALAAESMKM